MFSKILIANRGEIACRVISTARRLGVRTVAVYSDADANAQHVLQADEAVHVGAAPSRESYLQWQRIVDAALATGAQAVHPGYGFLSENQDFAKACAAAGLVFIGPPPAAIAAMGSKSAAKALMAEAGVPLVPGYHGADNTPALLAAEALRMGYPVLIKASAGGGGKGMRRVDKPEDFAAALASCQREALASFGDQHVLVERYVTRPRHIEIQVFGDQHGQIIHLNERDCSVQRRHQKVLEESPAPGLSAARRAQMGAAAVAAAKAVGYVGAGTVEFIAEPKEGGAPGDLQFYFMEMNTRLQVEHPVTEAVTGLDLVEWQLRVAAGEPLPLTQEQVPSYGHAIEARLCAESPERDFLPGSGTLQVARWPAHVRFARSYSLPRLDSGFAQGDTITPHYDSMIAKLIVWGEDRAQALARLDAALAETQLVGLPSNVAFLRRVVNTRAFATADLDTALIEREHAALFEAPPLAREWVAAAVAVHRWATPARQSAPAAHTHASTNGAASGWADPWAQRDGWRLHGPARRHLHLQLADVAFSVALERQPGEAAVLELGGQRWPLSYQTLTPSVSSGAGGSVAVAVSQRPVGVGADDIAASEGRYDIQLGAERQSISVYAHGNRLAIFAAHATAQVTEHDPLARAGEAARDGGGLTAPMPGKVISFQVQAGDAVRKGQPVAVMEAMKMEHTLTAPRDGVVQALLFAPGDQVPEGAELLRLVAADTKAMVKTP
jgi:3-methylcrotonyl-CoA carboxylase alpha subunit